MITLVCLLLILLSLESSIVTIAVPKDEDKRFIPNIVNTKYVAAKIRSVSVCLYSIRVLLIDRTISSVSTAKSPVQPRLRKILEVVIPFRSRRLAYHAASSGSGTSFRAEEENQAIFKGRNDDAEDDQDYDGDVDGNVDVERRAHEVVSSRRD
jgi:hypothetical protein